MEFTPGPGAKKFVLPASKVAVSPSRVFHSIPFHSKAYGGRLSISVTTLSQDEGEPEPIEEVVTLASFMKTWRFSI